MRWCSASSATQPSLRFPRLKPYQQNITTPYSCTAEARTCNLCLHSFSMAIFVYTVNMGKSRRQRTLRGAVEYAGIGLHTGQTVRLRFCPAEPNTGVSFVRTDLPERPVVPAYIDQVGPTARSTTIGSGPSAIHTVEHVLAAVAGMGIDNLLIEISGIEPPVGDGSSSVFVDLIDQAGIVEQNAEVSIRTLTQPLYWSEGDIHIVALPHDCLRVSYTLNYPDTYALRSQYVTLQVTPESFKQELSSCRSFGLYSEIEPLIDRGLIKGCSLANSVVVKDEVIFSKDGLRFPDEMARHKVLDLIGDVSLVGFPFHAHIIAIRSGHTSHKAFSLILRDHFQPRGSR